MSLLVLGNIIPGTALNCCSGNRDCLSQLEMKLLESVMWYCDNLFDCYHSNYINKFFLLREAFCDPKILQNRVLEWYFAPEYNIFSCMEITIEVMLFILCDVC